MKPIFVLIFLVSIGVTFGLKCQTDDGVTEEDVRRIVSVCMRKIGDNSYGEGSDYSEDNSNEYGQDDENDDRHAKSEENYRQRNRDHFRNSRGSFRNTNYQDYQYDTPQYRSGGGDRQRNQNISITEKQTERDRACIVHCFFQEMKMVSERR